MSWHSIIAGLLLATVSHGLRYNYGDGSYYVGEVDERGRPSGEGQFYNTEGRLGRNDIV